MLSIVIPTYNYNVIPLVEELIDQVNSIQVDYEILVMDDASTNTSLSEENKTRLNEKERVNYSISTDNRGREKTRQKLAESSNFHWLLFLDADTFPKNKDFIRKYIDAIEDNTKLIFGGIAYESVPPPKTKMLRWVYGRCREQLPVEKRLNNKYLTINSGAFLVDKGTFLEINDQITWGNYGLDILFTYFLSKNEIQVKHIDNPAFHLGLEDNQDYLMKSKKAIETLYFLQDRKLISPTYSSLQRMYCRMKKYGMVGLFRFLIKGFIPGIEKRLVSKKSSIYLFDLYRLFYFSELNTKKLA